jgi:hypothetical protein
MPLAEAISWVIGGNPFPEVVVLDFLKVKILAPAREKNPAIQDLDRYLEESQKD